MATPRPTLQQGHSHGSESLIGFSDFAGEQPGQVDPPSTIRV